LLPVWTYGVGVLVNADEIQRTSPQEAQAEGQRGGEEASKSSELDEIRDAVAEAIREMETKAEN
jgi:hypothetical protein